MPNKNESSSFLMWIDQIKFWPGRFFFIVTLIFIMIPFSLALLVLLPYFIQAINSTPAFLTWSQFLGAQASLWIAPYVQGTYFEKGFSLGFQREWFVPLLIFVSFTYGILNYLSDSMLRDYGERIARKNRTSIAKKYLSLSFNSATNVEAGLLSSMVGEDMREAQQSFTRLVSSLLKDGLASIIFITWLIILDYRLFVLFLAILIPAGIVLRVTGKTLKKLSKQGLKFESELLSGLLERMRGWQTIQVYGAIPTEIINFNKINDKIYHVWRRATRARSLGTPLVEWLSIIAGAFIIITALRRISDGLLSSQILTSFMVTVGFLSDKINRMTNQLNTTRKGTDALHRIQNFLSLNLETSSSSRNLEFSSVDVTSSSPATNMSSPALSRGSTESINSFEFKNLAIGNTVGHKLTENMNLQFKTGDLVAIIGPSGIGKSTLIRTLLGVQKPIEGSILMNGQEIKEEAFEKISSIIGFIPQEPFLFTGNIFENIVYPRKIINPSEDILEIAKNALLLANLDKNIFESILGLSGGEKQRLMFSRIFFHNPKLIIVDEGTSALDVSNEIKIIENLKHFAKNAITFVVAHRPLIQNHATSVLDLSQFSKISSSVSERSQVPHV